MPDRYDFCAHTPNGKGEWHSLEEHLTSVAQLAREFAETFGAGDLGYAAGLLHDVGKYSHEFQKYLNRCYDDQQNNKKGRTLPGGGDHKEAGALWSRDLFDGDKVNWLAFGILGHHGQVPAKSDIADKTLSPEILRELNECRQKARRDTKALKRLTDTLKREEARAKNDISRDMFLRMLYSCLLDADSLDTERHFDESKAELRKPLTLAETTVLFTAWLEKLEERQAELQAKASESAQTDKQRLVNQVRAEVIEACRTAAEEKQGVFRLTVPTGGGKTLASLGFALRHVIHNAAVPNTEKPALRRIIYAIPYTSIIDQTAQVFRDLLGEEGLLVHHSALPDERDYNERDGANGDGQSAWRRLASQNWDAPLIVTTTVQLFESLFSNKPGRCRKLHNLVGSVIILDEAQMLPLTLLQPIVSALKILERHYGVTVVFCTATQPAFTELSKHLKGFKEWCDIVPSERQTQHFQDMKRVDYHIVTNKQGEPEEWNWTRVAEEMKKGDQTQCLAVVNTRRHALELLYALGDPDAFHLSTLLCGAHRAAVLTEVRRRLKEGLPCRLVSTQVIECGVDVDFPRVLRSVGPFDRIIQCAGRCNREGRLEGRGEVIIFFPEDKAMPPKEYQIASAVTRDLLLDSANPDFDKPTVSEEYFRKVYRLLVTDAKGIAQMQKDLNFPGVANAFHMITQDTLPVLVCYEPLRELYDRILEVAATTGKLTREQWNQAQQIIVNVLSKDIAAQVKSGTIKDIFPDSPGVLYCCKNYDAETYRGLAIILNTSSETVAQADNSKEVQSSS